MIKTTVKAKTPLGLDKDGPGEIPVFLPEDWVGSLKDRNFEEPVLGMDGVPNFWREQLVWENPRIKASHTFFKSLAKDKDLNQVVPFALHLGPQFVVCYRRAGQPRSSVGRAGVGQPRSAVGRGRVEDKDRKQVVPFALHLGPQNVLVLQKGWTAQRTRTGNRSCRLHCTLVCQKVFLLYRRVGQPRYSVGNETPKAFVYSGTGMPHRTPKQTRC